MKTDPQQASNKNTNTISNNKHIYNAMAPIAKLENSPSNSSSTMTSISSMANNNQNPNSALVGSFPTSMKSSQIQQQQQPLGGAIKDPLTMSMVSSNIKSANQLSNCSASTLENPDFVTTAAKRRCFISVWSTWYCLLIVALHVYLINLHVIDIINLFQLNYKATHTDFNRTQPLTIYEERLKQLNDHIYFELVSRASLLGLSVGFLLFFVLASLKPIGNYSNDAIKFGRDFFSEKLMHNHINEISISMINLEKTYKSKDRCCLFSITNFLETMWRHFLPISHFCHLISILLLLFSKIIFANSISYSYDSISSCFNETSSVSMPSCLADFYMKLATAAQLSSDSLTAFDNMDTFLNQSFVYRFELISLGLALGSTFLRYGSVFWFTNKALAFLVTFIGLIAAVEQIFQVYSFIYIFQMLNDHELYTIVRQLVSNIAYEAVPGFTTMPTPATMSMTNNNLDLSKLASVYELPLLIRNKLTLLFLYFTLSMLVILSATPAYVFTFLKYKERFLIEESLYVRTFKHNNRIAMISSDNHDQEKNQQQYHKEMVVSTCCFNYCPHLIATIQLVVICVCKLPFCYDYIIYFNKLKDFGVMLVIIVEILHIIILIFIWLLLTLKTDWTMHIQTVFSICHWTYHLRFKNKNMPSKSSKKEQWLRGEPNYQQEKERFNNIDQLIRSKSTVHSSEYQQMDRQNYESVGRNVDANDEVDGTQPQLRRSVVTIRNNTNKSKQFKNTGNNIYQAGQQQPRNYIDNRHKSMFINSSDYVTECEPEAIKSANSDYLLNSETLYRNEIRKSIKNVLQQKQPQQSQRPVSQHGVTIPIYGQLGNTFNPLVEYECPTDPFFFNKTDNSKPKYITQSQSKNYAAGGVYLTTTVPQVFDSTNSGVSNNYSRNVSYQKSPAISKVVSTSTSKPIMDSNSNNTNTSNKEMSATGNNMTRSMVFLERPINSNNEYESRV